jgi:hypothetical protein
MSVPYGHGCYRVLDASTSSVVEPEQCVDDSAKNADMLLGAYTEDVGVDRIWRWPGHFVRLT